MNINSRPTKEPSKVILRITTITSITKSVGIAIAENFSIPPEIPPITIYTVVAMKRAWNKILIGAFKIKPPKNAPLSAPPKPAPELNNSNKNPMKYLKVKPPSTL